MKLKLLLLLMVALACSCEKDKEDDLAVETLPVSGIEYFPDTDQVHVTANGVLHGNARERGFILCKGNKFDFTKIPVLMDGDFACLFDELENGTLYYVKAYALGPRGAVYGEEVSFTASVLPVVEDVTDYEANLTGTTLLARGRIVSNGGGVIDGCGVYLGDSSDPLKTRLEAENPANDVFSLDLRGLSSGTDYTLTFFATNNRGEMRTEPRAFHTPDLTKPAVGIETFTEVAPTLVNIRARVTDDGGDPDFRYGLRYGSSATQLDREAVCSETDADGYFTASVLQLEPDTDYWFAAYAVNAGFENVETPRLQHTLAVSKPSVVNGDMRVGFEILDHLVLKGRIASTGGIEISEYGFYYGEGAATIRVQASDLNEAGTFSVTLDASAVRPLAEYVFSAYAVNEKGESRAAETTVKTGLVDRRSMYTRYLLDETMQIDASGRQLVYFTLPTFEIEVNGVRENITFLDRNLGATELPADAATMNFAAAGSYYSWGTNRVQASSALAESLAASGKDNTWKGYGTMPFSAEGTTWSGLVEQNTKDVINPCPDGYRLPTVDEWNAVCAAKSITSLQDMFEQFNFSVTNFFNPAAVVQTPNGAGCYVWTDNGIDGKPNANYIVGPVAGKVTTTGTGRKNPMPLRCVQVTSAE